MNVEVRNEAHLDIAEGVAFYDRQGLALVTIFINVSLRILNRCTRRLAFTKHILAIIAKSPVAILF